MSELTVINPAALDGQPYFELSSNNGEVEVVIDLDEHKEDTAPADDGAVDLETVLHTRPTLALGRLSFRRKYHSLQRESSPRGDGATISNRGALTRTSSLPGVHSPLTLQDIEELTLEEHSLQAASELRKSTRRLRERIVDHRQSQRNKPKAAKGSTWRNFKDVKWPKIRSRLRVLLSYELWRGHMKEVEGHFGTAVVSYFIFLRYLFFMNSIIFAFWVGFVVVPQIVWERNVSPFRFEDSQLACVFNAAENYTCAGGPNTTDLVFLLPSTCEASGVDPPFRVRRCGVNSSGIADRESSASPVTVSFSMPVNCTDENGSGSGSGLAQMEVQEFTLCSGQIAPYFPWYEYIIDFVLGQGLFNKTLLFHGWYSNDTLPAVGRGYELPVAFLVMTGIVYTVCVVLLVYKMGHAYNESYVEFGSKRNVNFSNKIFTAWDFSITDPNTAKLKRAHIRTDFEEELADHKKRTKKRSWKELLLVVIVRIFTNLLTIIVLILAGVAIFYAAQYGLDNRSDSLSLEGLVLPVVITVFNILLPFMFSFLARFERFKTQSGEIRMTLFRAIFVRLSSLIVLMVTFYILIQCTQDEVEESSDSTEEEGECSFDTSFIEQLTRNGNNTNTSSSSSDDCPAAVRQCWETFLGQEFYKLGLTNFVVSAASTLGVETFRTIVSRIKWRDLGHRIGRGNFNIAKSILDLIYTQCLLWLGFIFCPLLPLVILLTSFMLFYVKKYSLIWNLVPDKRGTFRSARTNFLFLFLMLASLFLFIVPIGFTIASLHPSPNCGPFRGKLFMYSALSEVFDRAGCDVQRGLDFVGSAGFVVPVLIFLLLVIYAQHVTLKSRKARFLLIKKQLILEGANVTHIVGKLDGVLKHMAKQREDMETLPRQQPKYLVDRIKDRRRQSAQAESLTDTLITSSKF